MKSVLAIETSTACCSVALYHQAQITGRETIGERVHHAHLLPMIDEILSVQGISLQALEGILISIGPGSFTGVRIGVSVAQSLGFALDLPLLPISSLWILAQTAFLDMPTQTPLALAVDARMQAAYCCQYADITWQDRKLVIPTESEQLFPLAEFEKTLASAVFLRGDAWTAQALQALNRPSHAWAAVNPLASSMPLLADYALHHGDQWVSPEEAQPVYLDKNLYASPLRG